MAQLLRLYPVAIRPLTYRPALPQHRFVAESFFGGKPNGKDEASSSSSIQITNGPPGHLQLIDEDGNVVMVGGLAKNKFVLQLDIARSNHPLNERATGLHPHAQVQRVETTEAGSGVLGGFSLEFVVCFFPFADTFPSFFATLHCLVDDATGRPWTDLTNQWWLNVWMVEAG